MTDADAALIAGLEDYLGAVLRPDPRAAKRTVEQMVDTGTPGRSIYLRVLQPALTRVGQLWALARITVAQEHLATAITMGVMARLAPTIGEAPAVGRRIILACTPGELHGVGVRMIADFLEGDGWEVLELGPATPTSDLVSIVRTERPEAVGLSTSLSLHLVEARATVAALRAVEPSPVVIVGGAAYCGDADLGRYVGADAFALDAGETSRLLRQRFGR